ncbi:hypothetical protein Lser_V15G18227 [Lactuca serriola]
MRKSASKEVVVKGSMLPLGKMQLEAGFDFGEKTIMANGVVVTPVGLSMLALAAEKFVVPLVILASIHKMSSLGDNSTRHNQFLQSHHLRDIIASSKDSRDDVVEQKETVVKVADIFIHEIKQLKVEHEQQVAELENCRAFTKNACGRGKLVAFLGSHSEVREGASKGLFRDLIFIRMY